MGKRMRDLDQLQEQDPEEGRRNMAALLLVIGVLISLSTGTFLLYRRASLHGSETAPDDLDRLQVVHKVVASKPAPTPMNGASDSRAAVDPTKLTFERALTEEEDRPEVLAALAAAEREEQLWAAADTGLDPRPPRPRKQAPTPAQPTAAIPASVAATAAGDQLTKSARHDQLVAAALPKPSSEHARGSAGVEGDYSLQVVSFETPAAAEGFASQLRERGHAAYVMPAHVDGRGRYWRVRVGPFKTRAAAEAYRHSFEERERMNTILVRRQDDE
jgi:cell division septation protein DedD